MLVFSQRISILDVIEYFLAKIDAKTQELDTGDSLCGFDGPWKPNINYLRLDGSLLVNKRDAMCEKFNNEEEIRFVTKVFFIFSL